MRNGRRMGIELVNKIKLAREERNRRESIYKDSDRYQGNRQKKRINRG